VFQPGEPYSGAHVLDQLGKLLESVCGPQPDASEDDDFFAEMVRVIAGETHLELSEWEEGFIKSNLNRKIFTDPQRMSITRMVKKYEISTD
jgi:hypothetical protein